MKGITPQLSKQVGWNLPLIKTYPTMDEVLNANKYQLLRWHRFLISARNEDELLISNKIFSLLSQ